MSMKSFKTLASGSGPEFIRVCSGIGKYETFKHGDVIILSAFVKDTNQATIVLSRIDTFCFRPHSKPFIQGFS